MNEESELPGGWVWTQIGDIGWVTKLAGFEFTKYFKYEDAGPVRVVRGLNIGFGEFKAKDFKYIDSSISDALPRSQLQGSELLIAYVGTLGTAAILPNDGHRYHLGPNVGKVVVESLLGNASFLLYFLISPAGQQLIRETSKAVAQSSLSMEQIRSFNVPLASLSEQQRIVSAIEQQFTRLDAGVAALRRAQAKLKRYRAAVLKAAVEGKLTEAWRAEHPTTEPASTLLERILKERRARWEADLMAKGKDPAKVKYVEPAKLVMEGLPELPGGWCWARVEQIGDVQLGRQRAPQYHTGLHVRPYLRVANVYEDHIDTSDIMTMNFTPAEYEIYQLKYGDILLNEGRSLELIGRPAMYRDEVPGACFQNTLIRFRVYTCLLAKYALTVFRVYLYTQRFQRIGKHTTNIAHLGAGRFAGLEFPLPPSC